MTTHLPALVTLLTVALLFWSIGQVGRARSRYGIKAPATTGNVEFERVFRVQMNTLEATILFLPSLWLAAHYWNPTWSGVAGIVWLLARVLYAITYTRGSSRTVGFVGGLLATAFLFFAAAWGIFSAMTKGA